MDRRMDELADLMKGAEIVRINESNPADIIRALTGQQPRSNASQVPYFDGHHSPSATDPISLEHIGVAQLEKGRRSIGKVIYLRILSQRDTELGTVFAAEDHTGAEIHVWSLIFRPLGVERIPRDTIIAIREPYFGRDPLESRSICLHHPTDCLYISRRDPIMKQHFETRSLPENTDFIKFADLAMIKGNFLEALNIYDCHLESIYRRGLYRVKDKNALLIKRAFCYDRAGGHYAALTDCVAILATDPTHKQALKLGYAKALARDLPSQALELAERLVQSQPDISEYQDMVSKAQAKVQESLGVFDLSLHIHRLGPWGTSADMSTFSGSLEIKLSSLGGRGVFATKNLNAGELLLCEKPMALGTSNNNSAFARGLQNILAGETSSQRHLSLLQNICVKALVDPCLDPSEDLRKKLFSLYAGDDFPHSALPSNPPPPIDTYRALSIIKHNCHTILPGIMSLHHDTGDLANQYSRDESLPSTKDFYAGLWYTGAMFNHSCLPNCTWSWIGDMFIVRANRAITAGEELTLAYIPSSNDYKKRRNTLKSQYGFECSCQLCEADANITPEDKTARTKISELLNKKFPNVVKLNGKVSSTALTNLEKHAKNVIQSYSSPTYTNLPHLLLADTYYQLAHTYLGPVTTWSTNSSASKLKAYECFISSLEIGLNVRLLFSPNTAYCELHLTETSLPRAVGILALIGLAELKFLEGRVKACRALKFCAKRLYGIVYGENETFGERHRSYACWKEEAEMGERPRDWEVVRERMAGEGREGPDHLK
ncbi:Histone-lysine N-methyltransferase SMYD3 [Pseudocercospora fuligena]|uniref:Histone-lysine N-methyltransferase SMYD3 n=1 Tax=Pseudocercospora fuligena TaxID=685502 RepID=A0A8H6VPY9_9PEZI|nr:Histone-lysine N-methyltransferase SMYD3 [Pseudocercospora fuligena]